MRTVLRILSLSGSLRGVPAHPDSQPESRRRRRLLLGSAAFVLLLLFLLLAGPVRSHALAFQVGPFEAGRIALVNLLKGPVRVGIQIGHLDAHLHPEEHAALRWNTGGHADGIDELEVNRAVAAELVLLLEERSVEVDLLPASVPIHYSADAILSLHADSVTDSWRNGYKSAFFEPARNASDPVLKRLIDEAYLEGSGLDDDSLNTSGTMINFYAFNPEYEHSVNPRSPALLIEMGYISNPEDRRFLLRPEQPATLIAAGLLAYLTEIGRLPPQSH